MESIRVVICDDNEDSTLQLTDYVHRLCREKQLLPQITCFRDGDELLDKYGAGTDFLFLDVEMPFVDGIAAAKQIRERGDSHVCIVFVSNYRQYAISGYQAGAWRYLIKPIDYASFERELTRPLENLLQSRSEVIYVRNTDGLVSIPVKDICYIEVNEKKNVNLVLEDQKIECYKPLSILQAKLDHPYFFRCHNSYLVNFNYIIKISKDTITVKNGDQILLSRHRKKEFMTHFMEYVGDIL